MTTLIVDWLGRGGIAQTTMRWQDEIIAGGGSALVASIAGRELDVDYSPRESKLPGPAGALVRHRRLASVAARGIDAHRPETVIVQNFIAPVLEQAVHDAARRVGARLIVVMHDHRSHSVLSGSRRGLRALSCRRNRCARASAIWSAARAPAHRCRTIASSIS